jgi:hypothetical protein
MAQGPQEYLKGSMGIILTHVRDSLCGERGGGIGERDSPRQLNTTFMRIPMKEIGGSGIIVITVPGFTIN